MAEFCLAFKFSLQDILVMRESTMLPLYFLEEFHLRAPAWSSVEEKDQSGEALSVPDFCKS